MIIYSFIRWITRVFYLGAAITVWGQEGDGFSVPSPTSLGGFESGGGVLVSEGNYELTNLDVIKISLFVADELQFTTDARVSLDGSVRVPYLDKIQVVGRTIDDVRNLLYEPYNRDYYVNPQIDLKVISYNTGSVTIMGKVNRQGAILFPSEEQMYLLEAIARAGGWSSDGMANRKEIRILRITETGEEVSFEVDATRISARDHELMDGDTIEVPERIW